MGVDLEWKCKAPGSTPSPKLSQDPNVKFLDDQTCFCKVGRVNSQGNHEILNFSLTPFCRSDIHFVFGEIPYISCHPRINLKTLKKKFLFKKNDQTIGSFPNKKNMILAIVATVLKLPVKRRKFWQGWHWGQIKRCTQDKITFSLDKTYWLKF